MARLGGCAASKPEGPAKRVPEAQRLTTPARTPGVRAWDAWRSWPTRRRNRDAASALGTESRPHGPMSQLAKNQYGVSGTQGWSGRLTWGRSSAREASARWRRARTCGPSRRRTLGPASPPAVGPTVKHLTHHGRRAVVAARTGAALALERGAGARARLQRATQPIPQTGFPAAQHGPPSPALRLAIAANPWRVARSRLLDPAGRVVTSCAGIKWQGRGTAWLIVQRN